MAQQAVEGLALPADGTVLVHNGLEYIVGARLSRANLAALPVGASVWNGGSRAQFYLKVDAGGDYGGWAHHHDDHVEGTQWNLADRYNQLRDIPDPTPLVDGAVVWANGTAYTIGDQMSTAQLDDLPVGSKVRSPRGNVYTKMRRGSSNTEPYAWKMPDREACSNLTSMYNRLVWVAAPGWAVEAVHGEDPEPDFEPEPVAVPDVVDVLPPDGTVLTYQGQDYVMGVTLASRADVVMLPEGSTLWSGDRRDLFWTKRQANRNRWVRNDRVTVQLISSDRNPVRSIPGSYQVVVPTTLPEFKEVFARAVTELTEQYTEAHQRVAARILGELDRAHPTVRVDPPVGTIATWGRPDRKGFTVFRFGTHGWAKIMGELESAEGLALDYANAEEAADQAGSIEGYKADAWAAGQRAKQDEAWCSAYDHLLARFGITDPDPHPDFSAWPVLIKGEEGRAELPVGAVLGVDRGDWGIFRKTAMPNDWTRVCGTRPLAAGTMRLLFDGVGDLRIRDAAALMPFLPDGSVCDDRGERGEQYDIVGLP